MKKSPTELLRSYFKDMPQETIQADWDSVKNLEFEGPTIADLLESTNYEVYRDESRTSSMAKLK